MLSTSLDTGFDVAQCDVAAGVKKPCYYNQRTNNFFLFNLYSRQCVILIAGKVLGNVLHLLCSLLL